MLHSLGSEHSTWIYLQQSIVHTAQWQKTLPETSELSFQTTWIMAALTIYYYTHTHFALLQHHAKYQISIAGLDGILVFKIAL